MVVKKNRLILIIAIILVLAAICGYVFINGINPGDYLKETGLFSQSPAQEQTDSSTDITTAGQNTESVPGLNQRSFETAVNKLYLLDSEGILDLNNITYHQILGRFVDVNGLADSWMIGAGKDGQSILLVYNSGEWNEQEWPGTLSEETIDLENITLPEDLYKKNSEIIRKTLEVANASYSDLSLKDGIYTISIQNTNNIAELKFKADSGEMI